jgi:hypothetical protein
VREERVQVPPHVLGTRCIEHVFERQLELRTFPRLHLLRGHNCSVEERGRPRICPVESLEAIGTFLGQKQKLVDRPVGHVLYVAGADKRVPQKST